MKKLISIAILSALPVVSSIGANMPDERVLKSKQVIKEFAGQLKGELKAAMKSGGPTSAINVCKDKAPVIAHDLSKKYGWEVARTSLKLRNPSNQADKWETAVLQKFDQRKAAGESVKKMAFAEEVKEGDKRSFRFMKAIPMGKACLQCHGDTIKPEISAKLNVLYPQDKATGFKLGDVRGAFTITQPIN